MLKALFVGLMAGVMGLVIAAPAHAGPEVLTGGRACSPTLTCQVSGEAKGFGSAAIRHGSRSGEVEDAVVYDSRPGYSDTFVLYAREEGGAHYYSASSDVDVVHLASRCVY